MRELAAHYRVLAPDLLGFGGSAKVVDFTDGRGLRIRHVARFCALLGITRAHFVGNSLGAVMLLTDRTSDMPLLPARKMVLICGGGEILQSPHVDALYDYDATLPAMRRIVEALLHSTSFPQDADYVRRRYESSIAPGAWEAVAAARFRRPGSTTASASGIPRYQQITAPTLVVEGEHDKLKPPGWAAEIAGRIPGARSLVVDSAGHCPQIERPELVNELLLKFFME